MAMPDPDGGGPNGTGFAETLPAPKRPRSDEPPARFVGFVIDHFSIGRRLGWGGMGAVYLAKDTSLERTVALKVLRKEMAAKADARERFVREARAQARLSSANVVQIYFVGHAHLEESDASDDASSSKTGPGTLYFAMEYVDGESLEAVIERGEKLEPERARALMIGAARGLADAHHAGLIHRDIKPGNLLVDKHGIVKVADFGLAKPSDPKFALTRGGVIVGTPHYMAPEQGSGVKLDYRADMYSLGCAFYHLLSGRLPFEGSNAVALIVQHLEKQPPPLRNIAVDVPPPLVAIIERLMKKNREERFATYDDLILALESAAPKTEPTRGLFARLWSWVRPGSNGTK